MIYIYSHTLQAIHIFDNTFNRVKLLFVYTENFMLFTTVNNIWNLSRKYYAILVLCEKEKERMFEWKEEIQLFTQQNQALQGWTE